MKKLILLVLLCGFLFPNLAQANFLSLYGAEERASDTAWWWWNYSVGADLSRSTGVVRSGSGAIEMGCDTNSAILVKEIYDPETDGSTVAKNLLQYCTWQKFPTGSVDTNGVTDIMGLVNTSDSPYNNNHGNTLLSTVNGSALRLRGECTPADYDFDIMDDQWHQYCVWRYNAGGGGSDQAQATVDGTLIGQCTGQTFTTDPNAFKVSCYEGIIGVTTHRYIDDLTLEVTAEVVANPALQIAQLQEQSVDKTNGTTKLGDCSAETELECVNGTHTEPGDGTNTNAAGTHAVKLDSLNECITYNYNLSASGVPPSSQILGIVMEADAVESGANNQVAMLLNNYPDKGYGGSNCTYVMSDYSSVFDWNGSLRLHKWAHNGTLTGGGSEDWYASNDEENNIILVGYDKGIEQGNWRLETTFINVAYIPGVLYNAIMNESWLRLKNWFTPRSSWASVNHSNNFIVGFKKTKNAGNWRLENLYTAVAYKRPS